MQETELKLRGVQHDVLRHRLQALGAEFIAAAYELNLLFDDDAGGLRRTDRGLRLRLEWADDPPSPVRPQPTRALLTYKGPRAVGSDAVKQREEIETEVDDADAVTAILAAIGLRPRVTFEKRRETWRLGECHVCLDILPRLGEFVEVEGPAAAGIHAACAALGCEHAEPVPQTYVELIAAETPATPDGRCELRFDTETRPPK